MGRLARASLKVLCILSTRTRKPGSPQEQHLSEESSHCSSLRMVTKYFISLQSSLQKSNTYTQTCER